jgi:hypothetical protein
MGGCGRRRATLATLAPTTIRQCPPDKRALMRRRSNATRNKRHCGCERILANAAVCMHQEGVAHRCLGRCSTRCEHRSVKSWTDIWHSSTHPQGSLGREDLAVRCDTVKAGSYPVLWSKLRCLVALKPGVVLRLLLRSWLKHRSF